MTTEVLLMADVKDLGAEGDIVSVSDGYARNCLFPKKLAAPVSETTKRRLSKMRATREEAVKTQLEAARAKASGMENVSCTIPVKITEGGKMFGSVGPVQIAAQLEQQGIGVDKDQILLEAPIKEVGVYNVGIKLHPEITVPIKVWIVEE